MTYRPVLTLLVIISLVFTACNTQPEETGSGGTDVQYTPLKANDDGTGQKISNGVKDILDQFDEINTIKAVNSPKTVIAAVEVDHIKRFKLKNLEKKYRQAIMDEYPDMIIELSTDKKLVVEIGRLEKQIKQRDINRNTLEAEIQRLIKLMRKKT